MAGKNCKLTDDGRPSEPVSFVEGSAACTQPAVPSDNASWYQRRYASALVPSDAAGPASIDRSVYLSPGLSRRFRNGSAPSSRCGEDHTSTSPVAVLATTAFEPSNSLGCA